MDKKKLTEADIITKNTLKRFKNTEITEAEFDLAWDMPDVQRYAKRYRWSIAKRTPLILKRSEGPPVEIF